MSAIYKVTVFEQIQIEITTLTHQKLLEIEEKLILSLKQKLSKLASLLRNPSLTVYCHDGHIFVNDKYTVLNDFTEIVKAFGMDVKSVNCSLRGQSFIISDTLIELLKQMQSDFELSGLLAELDVKSATSNAQLAEQLRGLIEQNKFVFGNITSKYGTLISEVSKSLRATKTFNIGGVREVEQTRDKYGSNDILLGTRELGVSSDKANVEERLKQFVSDIDSELKANNKHMQNGVTEMLYSRAKQLGYSVQKQRNGDTVQLVVVGVQ